jgi:hypothetical protein
MTFIINHKYKILSLFSVLFIFTFLPYSGGARGGVVLLRHYATNRNVAGSIPDGVIGINSLT